ncbi:MAG: ATP-binding protein [Herminiimonas sp.]|uniref:PAS domain-containing hybrid sensor histidine kinase/response regulator n=1 Tax=Herminiimonas sp. TaxID=1926289 RepID=UPI0027259B08|nr:ATP-binding protein [Herminiimonas sp.]MDO9419267.1 ATP-binding protein [Herminiimonas sp.]
MDTEQNIGAMLDDEIRKRKQAEAALVARDREFIDFVENAAVGLHQVGFDGTILWANKAELDLLGYTPEEYIGRNITEFHADASTIDDILCRLTAGDTILDYPARLKCKDGRVKHVLIHSNGRFENGKLIYTRCFTRDVTDKIIREQVLSERNNLLLQAPVATALLIGPEFTFELANDMYKHIVGRNELEGKSYLEVFPELRGTPLPGILQKVYETGEAFASDEYQVKLVKDGKQEDIVLKFNLQALRGASGDIVGMMAVAVDITELVQSREAQKHSQVERETLLRKLEDSDRAKDEFLAILGHELRNPLSPIVTALDLMKLRGDVGSTKEYGILQRQVKHLLRLVDDLLDVSRITRGKVDLRKSTVVVREVIKKAVEMVSVLAEQKHHTLHIDDQALGLEWYGDPIRLSQVISNLLTNAVHYTPNGGHITLRCWKEDNQVCISVSDNGIGISNTALSKIFDLFYQVPGRTERAKGGLGIGLSLVNSLVLSHGGTVQAFSDGEGKGSEFLVRLPLLEDVSQANIVSSRHNLSSHSYRVMIVDDNKDAADTLNDLLIMNGYTTKVAYDPITALAIAKSYQPEVVITDIGMPVMNGYDLAVHLRNVLDNPSTCRMYAVSGFGQKIDKERSQKAGFAAYFVRPVDAETLLEAISAEDH